MIYYWYYYLINFSTYIYISIIMKKIKTFIIVTCLCILLCWCWLKWRKIIYIYENFYWSFFTENLYNTSTTELSSIWNKLLQNDIIAIYDQKNWSWFIWSIIISKRASDKSLQEFVSENIKQIKKDWFKTEVSKSSKFMCNGKSIETITTNSKLKTNLNTVYFSQSFFIKWNNVYIISFATSNIDERNNFSNNIKNTYCN